MCKWKKHKNYRKNNHHLLQFVTQKETIRLIQYTSECTRLSILKNFKNRKIKHQIRLRQEKNPDWSNPIQSNPRKGWTQKCDVTFLIFFPCTFHVLIQPWHDWHVMKKKTEKRFKIVLIKNQWWPNCHKYANYFGTSNYFQKNIMKQCWQITR